MKQETADQRCVYLEKLTGLKVIGKFDPRVSKYYFEFLQNTQCLKTVFSYKKALAFAEGIKIGRTLTPIYNQPTMKYKVVVSDIGVAFESDDRDEAFTIYNSYVAKSKTGSGRVGDEAVCIFEDDHIICEHSLRLQ